MSNPAPMSTYERALPKAVRVVLPVMMLLAMHLWNTGNAQTPDESKATIDSLLKVAWSEARNQPEEGIAILEGIEDIQARQDTPHKVDVVYYYYGVFYKNLNRYDESEAAFNKYQAYHEGKENPWRVASVNMAKANLYSDMGDLPKSMEAASKSLGIFESLNDTSGMLIAGSKMGYLLSEVGRLDEALKYNRRSNRLAIQAKDASEQVISYTNIALVFEKKEMNDSAFAYYAKAYGLGETLDNSYSKVINRFNMATILYQMDETALSVPYVRSCMELADSINIPSLRAASRRLYAELKLRQGDAARAAVLLDSLATGLNHELGLKDQSEVFMLLAEAYSQKGEYKTAYTHLNSYKLLSDSLLGKESRDKINELEIAFETEKRDQKIALLDVQNKASQAMIAQKDRTILITVIGLSLLTLLSIVLFVLIRKYIRQKRALSNALSDKDLLLREIHHRVKNNLQIVSSLLSLQGRSLHDETALQAINDGKSRVRSMALIHQNLYQRENLTGVKVQEYVAKLIDELMQTYKVDADQVQAKLDIKPLELDVDTLVPLGLIINELVTNALKYAFPHGREGSISVSLDIGKQMLTLEVRDDGVGFDQANLSSDSFGQKLVRSLVKQLDGTIELKSENGTWARLEARKFKSL